jgi:hypothetical protein
MIRLAVLFIFSAIATLQGQTSFSKGTYTTLNGVTTDAYIESRNWNEPFESIRVKTAIKEVPETIETAKLMKMTVSPLHAFVRQMVWRAPIWEPDNTRMKYTKNEAVFMHVIGYGKASLFTYYEESTQRIVYQTQSNRFVELVPPNSNPSSTGKPLDFKDQIRADFKSSLYQERDLRQLHYSLTAITEFVRNYNSYIRDDNNSVAYSDVVRVETVPRGETSEGANSEVPFAFVEKSPVFPGCEKLATEEEIRTCFSTQLEALFDQHFKYPKEAKPEDKEKKFFVQFLIERDGSVQLKTMRVPHPSIEAELRRIFGKIPKLKAGLMKGKPASVTYMQAFKMKVKK